MNQQNITENNTQLSLEDSVNKTIQLQYTGNETDNFLFLYEDLNKIEPIRHKSFNIDGYDEKHVNNIVIAYLFVIKDNNLKKNDPQNQVLLKSFPYDVCSDDTNALTQQQLERIHYHSVKKFYDYRVDDYKAKINHFKHLINDYNWIKSPKTDIVFARYKIEKAIGCQHYIAGCELECAICKQFFGCRMCHEDQIDDHVFPRYEVEHVKCRYCGCVQKFQQQCQQCGLIFGKQYCQICKLISNLGTDSKPFYHDEKLNVCQIGYKNENVYCEKCNYTYPEEMYSTHNCAKQMQECPVCLSNLSNSNYTSIFLNCSHQLHQHCYMQLLQQNNFKCPVCYKFLPVEYDREYLLQSYSTSYSSYFEIPGEMEVIVCNDCGRKFLMPQNPIKYCPFCNLFNCDVLFSSSNDIILSEVDYENSPCKMLKITQENIQKVITDYQLIQFQDYQPTTNLVDFAKGLNQIIYIKQFEQNDQDENESDFVVD